MARRCVRLTDAAGHLTGDGHVVVPDQAAANRLYNKGYAGLPQKGGALRLSLVEAAWLLEEDRLVIHTTADDLGAHARPLTFQDVFRLGVENDPHFEIAYLAYREMRSRGRVVKHANKRKLDFLIHAEGEAPPKDQPKWLAGAMSERAPLSAMRLRMWLDEAKAEDASLLMLLVDEEGDITHYEMESVAPSGGAPKLGLPAPVHGEFVEDRVMVWDATEAKALRDPHFLGQPLGSGLQLSLVEAGALIKANLLDVEGFWADAESVQPDLKMRLVAYQDMRSRGLWVKTGFKFGTHFRVYDRHPDETHAPWLVHTILPDWESSWPELSRAVRLAHGVKKTMVFAIVDANDGRVHYVGMRRVRP